jgi:uncharacterized ferredoxin-like protein
VNLVNGENMSKIENNIEKEAVLTGAKLMASSARTAPKGRGLDRTSIRLLIGDEIVRLAEMMEKKSEKKIIGKAFKRDAKNVRNSQAILLLGVNGTVPKKPEDPINCGACGFEGCSEFMKTKKNKGEDFVGPLCVFEILDLGIAIGSAVKLASYFNIDNRIMYTIGAAAKESELLDSDLIIGIPLSASGKNIYFDRT